MKNKYSTFFLTLLVIFLASNLGLFPSFVFAANTNPWPASGSVGIGTASPVRILDVRGDVLFYSDNQTASEGVNVFYTGSASYGGGYNLHLGVSGATPSGSTLKGELRVLPTSGDIMLATYDGSNNHDAIHLKNSNGYVGIGTTTPGKILTVVGEAYVSATTTIGVLCFPDGTCMNTAACNPVINVASGPIDAPGIEFGMGVIILCLAGMLAIKMRS